MTPPYKIAFTVLAVVAAAAEGVMIYRQWPPPPVKICASVEFGELLAAAARSEALAREARARLRTDPDEAAAKEAMHLESQSAAALIAVANFRQRAQEKQKTSSGACN